MSINGKKTHVCQITKQFMFQFVQIQQVPSLFAEQILLNSKPIFKRPENTMTMKVITW